MQLQENVLSQYVPMLGFWNEMAIYVAYFSNLRVHNPYGSMGCGVFKRGIQN